MTVEPKVSRIISIGCWAEFVFQAICQWVGCPLPQFSWRGRAPWQGRERQLLPVSDASLDSRGRDWGRTEKSRNFCLPCQLCLAAWGQFSLRLPFLGLPGVTLIIQLFSSCTGRCRADLGSPESLEGSLKVGCSELRAALFQAFKHSPRGIPLPSTP